MISDRAKRLVLALHEPFSNEARWKVAEAFLAEERAEALWTLRNALGYEWLTEAARGRLDFGPTHDDVSGRIAQTRAQNEDK